MNFLSVEGSDDGRPFKISHEVSPADLAKIDQQRAEGSEILHTLVSHTMAHVILMHLHPDDNISIEANATHLAVQIMALERGQAIAVINLALEAICNAEVDALGGYGAAAKEMGLENLRAIFHRSAKEREEGE